MVAIRSLKQFSNLNTQVPKENSMMVIRMEHLYTTIVIIHLIDLSFFSPSYQHYVKLLQIVDFNLWAVQVFSPCVVIKLTLDSVPDCMI